MTSISRFHLKPLTLAVALALAGCSTLNPTPLEEQGIRDRAAADRAKMFEQQEPIAGPLTLEEAVARALKYNLDLRLKKMEVAVNSQLHEVSKFDMLPSVVAGAGYMDRNNFSGGDGRTLYGPQGSRPDEARERTLNFSTSADMNRRLRSVEFSWNVLDLGVSYYRARQRANEFLMSQERRRRVIQTMVHDVRFAFHRALAAQKLADEATEVMKQAEQAIARSRAAESSGAIPVQTALAYQRALIDAVALLNLRRQDLDFAKAELAALMSVPGHQFTLRDTAEQALQPIPTNLTALEDAALLNRPELREEDLRKRISAEETRRQLLQALPNLSLGIGSQYDSNSLLYNNDWVENSVRASWSLLRLLSAPAVKKAGERQIEVDDARRQALAMAVLTQTRIAVLRYGLARSDLDLAQRSLEVDARVASVARSGVSSKVETELELVRANARAVVAKYQRAIAYANAQAAFARIQHSLGQDLELGEMDGMNVAQLAQRVGQAMAQADRQMPSPKLSLEGVRPKVQLHAGDAAVGPALLAGVSQGLTRSGFEVVTQAAPDVLSLRVSWRTVDAAKGLRQGEVTLSPTQGATRGAAPVSWTAMLPAELRDTTFTAMGEAAATANGAHLRGWTLTP